MKRHATALLAGVALTLLTSLALAQDGGWGTIKGRVVWPKGEDIPQRAEIKAVEQNVDKAHRLSKGPLLSEDRIINPKNRGIRWAFVWLAQEDPTNKLPLPIHPKLQAIKQRDVPIDQPI